MNLDKEEERKVEAPFRPQSKISRALRSPGMKYVRDILTIVLVAALVYVLLHVTISTFEVFQISGLPNIKPGDWIIVEKVSYFFGKPERGDVIVFRSPVQEEDLIKRIIGLPGDSDEVKDGKVYINGVALNEPYTNETPTYKFAKDTVPEGYYFALGDNRNQSADSHNGWYLPRANIVGKAWLIYWPPKRWGAVPTFRYSSIPPPANGSP
jgi:signal peptidase I